MTAAKPDCIKHWTELEDPSHYPDSDELMSIGAPLGSRPSLSEQD